MMLDHSVGVPALRAKVKDSGPYEWDYMTERLADEEPFWAPGTRNGYHGFTFGWTVGEMVRRASRQVARHLLPGRDRQAARPRLLDRPARGDRAARRADDPLHLQGGRGQDAVHGRPRDQERDVAGVAVLLQRRRLAHRRRQHAATATPPRSARPTASPMRAGWPACMRRWRKAAASWSTARRSPAWARSRWRRTTTPPCASRRASRWAS